MSVKHVPFDAHEILCAVIGVVAHGSVEVRKEDLQEDVGGKRLLLANEFLHLKHLLQVMKRYDDLVPDRHDEMAADDKIDLLVFRPIAVFLMRGEMQHQERHPLVARSKGRGGREEHLGFEAFVNGKFACDLPYLFRTWFFKIDPGTSPILIAEYHAGRIPRLAERIERRYGTLRRHG